MFLSANLMREFQDKRSLDNSPEPTNQSNMMNKSLDHGFQTNRSHYTPNYKRKKSQASNTLKNFFHSQRSQWQNFRINVLEKDLDQAQIHFIKHMRKVGLLGKESNSLLKTYQLERHLSQIFTEMQKKQREQEPEMVQLTKMTKQDEFSDSPDAVTEQILQPKNKDFMISCFKAFLQTLPEELIDVMCQTFIQNWINEEDGFKDGQLDQNITAISDQRSMDNLNGKFELQSTQKSPRMAEKPMMLIEDDHQLLMSETKNAIINKTTQPKKPVACSQVNPFQYLNKDNYRLRDNSSQDDHIDYQSQDMTRTVKRPRRNKIDRLDRTTGGTKTTMHSTVPTSHAQRTFNQPQSTKNAAKKNIREELLSKTPRGQLKLSQSRFNEDNRMIERGAGERNNVINKSVNWSSVLNSQRSPQNAMITVKQTPRNEKDMKSMKVTMAKNSKFNQQNRSQPRSSRLNVNTRIGSGVTNPNLQNATSDNGMPSNKPYIVTNERPNYGSFGIMEVTNESPSKNVDSEQLDKSRPTSQIEQSNTPGKITHEMDDPPSMQKFRTIKRNKFNSGCPPEYLSEKASISNTTERKYQPLQKRYHLLSNSGTSAAPSNNQASLSATQMASHAQSKTSTKQQPVTSSQGQRDHTRRLHKEMLEKESRQKELQEKFKKQQEETTLHFQPFKNESQKIKDKRARLAARSPLTKNVLPGRVSPPAGRVSPPAGRTSPPNYYKSNICDSSIKRIRPKSNMQSAEKEEEPPQQSATTPKSYKIELDNSVDNPIMNISSNFTGQNDVAKHNPNLSINIDSKSSDSKHLIQPHSIKNPNSSYMSTNQNNELRQSARFEHKTSLNKTLPIDTESKGTNANSSHKQTQRPTPTRPKQYVYQDLLNNQSSSRHKTPQQTRLKTYVDQSKKNYQPILRRNQEQLNSKAQHATKETIKTINKALSNEQKESSGEAKNQKTIDNEQHEAEVEVQDLVEEQEINQEEPDKEKEQVPSQILSPTFIQEDFIRETTHSIDESTGPGLKQKPQELNKVPSKNRRLRTQRSPPVPQQQPDPQAEMFNSEYGQKGPINDKPIIFHEKNKDKQLFNIPKNTVTSQERIEEMAPVVIQQDTQSVTANSRRSRKGRKERNKNLQLRKLDSGSKGDSNLDVYQMNRPPMIIQDNSSPGQRKGNSGTKSPPSPQKNVKRLEMDSPGKQSFKQSKQSITPYNREVQTTQYNVGSSQMGSKGIDSKRFSNVNFMGSNNQTQSSMKRSKKKTMEQIGQQSRVVSNTRTLMPMPILGANSCGDSSHRSYHRTQTVEQLMRSKHPNASSSLVSGYLSASSSRMTQHHSPLLQSVRLQQSRQNSVSSMSSRKLKIEVKDGRHFINIENNNNPNHVKKALLIIDVQNDFSFGGAVPINGSLYVINKINQIREFNCFDMIIVSRDWHPRGHISFVGSHTKDKPFQKILVENTGELQMLWPEHCVQWQKGSEYHSNLIRKDSDIEVLKGQNKMVDSYSAFGNSREDTGLHKILGDNHIDEVFCVGLTFDYGVGMTAMDSAKRCFKTYVVEDACSSLSPSSDAEMRSTLKKMGVQFILSEDVKGIVG